MKKKLLFIILICIPLFLNAQITLNVSAIEVDKPVTITVNINSTTSNCNGFNNPAKVYMHAGIGDKSNAFGFNVIGNWGADDGVGEMISNNDGTFSITITPKDYFNLSETQIENAAQLGLVFRNEDGSQELKGADCSDFILPIGIVQLNIKNPTSDFVVVNSGDNLEITAEIEYQGSTTVQGSIEVFLNDVSVATATCGFPSCNATINNITESGVIRVVGTPPNSTETGESKFEVYIQPSIIEETIPVGMKDGINLNATDNTKATLVFYAPEKEFVHVIGNFNNWKLNDNYLLKKDPSQDRFWIELTNLTPRTNYTYQYVINADLRVADPYSTTILTESNDQYINEITYPNLPSYPSEATNHALTLLRTGDEAYVWKTTNFEKPAKTDLVIYEILIRDFDELHSYDAVKNRLDYLQDLGINAIEFMPVMEFDGNESWGYNPSFHMALDKYYGNTTSFKQFIDECHKRGIAVIIDVAFNHASGQNPYYRMYNTDNGGYGGQASADSPFFNQTSTHSYSVFNDFNHSKQAVQDYVKRVSQYWIDEYKIDGFRWDLTKGFTQNCSSGDACTNAYQQDRVDILKEYADYQWEIDPNFYIIFEHLGSNTEETEWVNYRLNEGKGIMLWGNHNHEYNQATMGFSADFSWISYKNRGWSVPANVSYMESHDEERLMYNNLQYGNASGNYDVTNLSTALEREELAGAFYFTIPGPKMIWQFGELGYDISINENGRTGNKPINWAYFDNQERKNIYNTWSKLIQLKQNFDVFKTSDFTLDVGNSNGLKKIHLTNNDATDIQQIVIIGNFGVTTQNITPSFQETGTWYNLLEDNATITVTNTEAQITLTAGEFKVYGNKAATLSTDNLFLTDVVVYPNPVKNTFKINTETNNVILFDLNGKKIKEFSGNFNADDYFSVEGIKKGLYLLKVSNLEGKFYQKLIID